MRRPIGVILSCIVLGVLAAFHLLAALGLIFMTYFVGHLSDPVNTGPGGPTPVSNSVVSVVLAVTAFLCVLVAAWAIATLYGLFRLRNWARWSVVVIACCILGLSLLLIFGAVVTATFAPVTPNPALSPDTMHTVLLIEILFYAIAAMLAGWWLVYFNLRSTKNYFLPVYVPAYAPPFGFAPELAAATAPPPMPASVSRWATVPAPVTVVAIFFFLGAVTLLPSIFLPYPLVAFGFLIPPAAAHAVNAILAGLFVLIGIGLLRLDNRARLAVFFFAGLSVANALVLATPWGRTRMDHYVQQMFATMNVPSYGMEAMLHSPLLWVFTGAFWVVLYGAIIWVLQRYRRDFKAGGAVAV